MNKLILAFTLLIVGFLEVFSAQYVVTAQMLNVRERATSNSPVLFKLNQGDIVEGENNGNWTFIFFRGKSGYVNSKYIDLYMPSPSALASTEQSFYDSAIEYVYSIYEEYLKKIRWWSAKCHIRRHSPFRGRYQVPLYLAGTGTGKEAGY